jgi:hypothetical protein
MRRALPYLAAAAVGASLLLSFLQHYAQVLEARERARQAAIDGVSYVDAFVVHGFWVIVLGVATLLYVLVAPRKRHWIAGIVLFGVAVATVATTWHIRAEVHVLSHAAWGAAALGGLLMVVTSGIEKKA